MPRKTNKKMTETTKTQPVKILRDVVKKPNGVIAKEVLAGKYGDDWRYVVRRKGYSVKAIEVLLNGNAE